MAGVMFRWGPPEAPAQAFMDRAAAVDYVKNTPYQPPKTYWESFSETPSGRFLTGAWDALKLPGDVYAGRIDPASEEGQQRAFDLAGLVGGGAPIGSFARLAEPQAAEFAAKNADLAFASRNPKIYDPPVKPPRPFEADYPAGAQADAAGNLLTDIDGRPLTARYVVGRKTLGGADEAIPAAELDALAAQINGTRPTAVAPGTLGRNVGKFVIADDPVARQNSYNIYAVNNLSPVVQYRVVGHEVGHAIDYFAGNGQGIPENGIKDRLAQVYHDLNDPSWRRGVETPPKYQATPEVFGYKGADIQAERRAEAVRAYLSDPNYLKTTAPDVAARIRESANPSASPRASIR